MTAITPSVRIGVRGWSEPTLTAAARLSLAGLTVVEAGRRALGEVDVLISDHRVPADMSIRIDELILSSRADSQDLLLAVAAMLGQPS